MFLTAFARPAAAADAEPRVARVAFVEGEASYLNADADEWTAVDVNAPLVTGDRFWSGSDGRAEIQLPGGVYARLSSDTEVELLEVSDQAVQVKVGVGTATFRLREVPAGQHVEFSTPTTALVARLRGVYRIDVAEDGQTTVAVRDGEADAYLGDERYRLERGRGARIVDANYVTDDVPPIEVFDATQVANDPWDDWEAQRAARLQNASSYQYVDADVYGAEDLDDYGSWDRHETYGPIWRPTHVAAGWSPFTQGRWVWQDPWGWTWVDYEPWGWAPSHYGRWVYVQDAWAWAPGPVVARPAYAPATVGFLGVSVNTPSVSVSVGIGPSVGWVPLGWGEPVIPWWGGVWGAQRGRPWWGGWGGPRVVNNTVVKNINNVNITNINYANIDRGFYATSRDSFVRGDLRRLDVPRERMREAFRPLRGAPDVIPARESLFAARPDKLRGGRGGRPPQEILQRAAVSTRAVPAARPDFGRKLQLIERDKGAPVAPQQLRQLARQSAEREQVAPRVRTVAAKGRKPVVPEVTAQAPQRLNAPLQRAMRPGEARDERAARAEHSPAGQQRATLHRNDTPRDGASSPQEAQRDAALGERRMPPPGNAASRAKDPRRAAREDAATAGREGRALPQAQQPAAVQDRAQQASRDEAQRQRVERAQQQREQREQVREQRAQDPRTGRAERAVPGARQGEAVGAPQGRAQRDEAQRDQAGRARPEQAPTRQAEQAARDAQREQAQRARRASTQGDEQAARARQDEARRQQVEQAQREGRQRQQADARRDGEARQQREAAQAERTRQAAEARQRQADQQREAAQAERRQAQQATAQRQNAERQQAQRQAAQRQQAERQQAQRQAAQRQQAERQAAQRQQAQRQAAQRQQAQRQQSMQRQAQPQQQGEDPRSAQRREKRQQQRRQPEG
jgi:hypothetical protein